MLFRGPEISKKSRARFFCMVLPGKFADPFGVLDPLLKGRLVAPDRDDRVQLATLSRVATRAGGELGAAVNSLSELPVDEQREALAELGDLLWRNRAGASKASRRIAALLLEQGLERVGA